MDQRELVHIELGESGVKGKGVKDSLGNPTGVHEALERRDPNPSTQGIGAVSDHDNSRNVNDLQVTTKTQFSGSDFFDKRMKNRAFRRTGCRNPIGSRIVGKIKHRRSTDRSGVILFELLKSQVKSL
jgi:hypothetical protein